MRVLFLFPLIAQMMEIMNYRINSAQTHFIQEN